MADRQDQNGTFRGLILRQPFAVFGAISLISLASDIVVLDQNIVTVVSAIRTIFYYIWEFLFIWLPFDLASWQMDYMTVGAIVSGMTVRMRFYRWAMLNKREGEGNFLRFSLFDSSTFVKIKKGNGHDF